MNNHVFTIKDKKIIAYTLVVPWAISSTSPFLSPTILMFVLTIFFFVFLHSYTTSVPIPKQYSIHP